MDDTVQVESQACIAISVLDNGVVQFTSMGHGEAEVWADQAMRVLRYNYEALQETLYENGLEILGQCENGGFI